MVGNQESETFTTEKRGESPRHAIIAVLLFIAVSGILGVYAFSTQVQQKLTATSMVYPWDPLEWDTLRDSPFLYKSLGDGGEFQPTYATLIKKPADLGFVPDEVYFNSILSLIKKNHVKKPSDNTLRQGCEYELKALFKAGGINDTFSMSGYDVSSTLISRLQKDYGSKVKSDLITLACIRGLLRALKDPYTTFMTPRDYNVMMERLQEKAFGGVGIYVELDRENHNRLTVVEPIEGTPAFRAGIHTGDVIEKINGEITVDMLLEDAVARMRGPVETEVLLSIRRRNCKELKDFALKRASINVPSVSYRFLDGHVGYIRIRMFGNETSNELDRALDNLNSGIPPAEEINPGSIREVKTPHCEPATSLIIDLRNNGGGYLNSAVEIASKFIPSHRVVFKKLDSSGSMKDFYTLKSTVQSSLPLVVLVNRYSASSSEILAGALKENDAATLMGDRTFGKGSVQQMYKLKDNSALKLTISYFLTPTGKIINKKGLKPHVFIPMKPTLIGKDGDVQLRKAVEFLQKKSMQK